MTYDHVLQDTVSPFPPSTSLFHGLSLAGTMYPSTSLFHGLSLAGTMYFIISWIVPHFPGTMYFMGILASPFTAAAATDDKNKADAVEGKAQPVDVGNSSNKKKNKA